MLIIQMLDLSLGDHQDAGWIKETVLKSTVLDIAVNVIGIISLVKTKYNPQYY